MELEINDEKNEFSRSGPIFLNPLSSSKHLNQLHLYTNAKELPFLKRCLGDPKTVKFDWLFRKLDSNLAGGGGVGSISAKLVY